MERYLVYSLAEFAARSHRDYPWLWWQHRRDIPCPACHHGTLMRVERGDYQRKCDVCRTSILLPRSVTSFMCVCMDI